MNGYLFAGESFSGKSSILNLLFGEDLVPTSYIYDGHSIIFRIHYYKERRIKIKYKNGGLKKIMNIPPGEIYSKLRPFFSDHPDRSDLISEIKVYIPAKILEVMHT